MKGVRLSTQASELIHDAYRRVQTLEVEPQQEQEK